MPRSIIVALSVVACLALAGCGSTGTKFLDNVSNDCERHYDGAVTGGITGAQFTGTVKVDCQPSGRAAAPAPAPIAASAAAQPPL
jgi:hypothetical protein